MNEYTTFATQSPDSLLTQIESRLLPMWRRGLILLSWWKV